MLIFFVLKFFLQKKRLELPDAFVGCYYLDPPICNTIYAGQESKWYRVKKVIFAFVGVTVYK
jgi:hypothetical protein